MRIPPISRSRCQVQVLHNLHFYNPLVEPTTRVAWQGKPEVPHAVHRLTAGGGPKHADVAPAEARAVGLRQPAAEHKCAVGPPARGSTGG